MKQAGREQVQDEVTAVNDTAPLPSGGTVEAAEWPQKGDADGVAPKPPMAVSRVTSPVIHAGQEGPPMIAGATS